MDELLKEAEKIRGYSPRGYCVNVQNECDEDRCECNQVKLRVVNLLEKIANHECLLKTKRNCVCQVWQEKLEEYDIVVCLHNQSMTLCNYCKEMMH